MISTKEKMFIETTFNLIFPLFIWMEYQFINSFNKYPFSIVFVIMLKQMS